jgi:hypothetical protein
MADETKNGSVIDLADLDMTGPSEKGAVMEVRHPATGETLRHDDGRPQTITVLGRDSEKFLTLARKQNDRRIQQTMRTRMPASSAAIEKDDIELLVTATIDWDIYLGGAKPEANAKNFRDAYTRFRWLREQVDEFAGNRSNFLKG